MCLSLKKIQSSLLMRSKKVASTKQPSFDQVNYTYQKWVLLIGLILLAFKLGAYFLTNSNAILTDALEGIANIAGAALGLFSVYYATLPSDKNHPYGHGKIEYLSSGFEGSLIAIAGLSMIGRAIYSFWVPNEISFEYEAIILVTVAGIINYIMGVFMVKQGKKAKSVQLQAGGKHLISDGYTTAGLLLGLTLIWLTKLTFLDNVLAIFLGAFICWEGFKILRKSVAGVMDEANIDLVDEVASVIQENRAEKWVDVHNFKLVQYGARIHLDAHLTLPYFLSLKEAHAETDLFEEVVADNFSAPIEFSIHTEPCISSSCAICTYQECTHRQSKFVKKIAWNSTYILKNEHHKV